MSRRLERGEAPTKGVRRIVRRESKKALDELPTGGRPKDVAVHDARKRIKRARAALRLVREPLGEKRYRRENESLRDAAAPLGAVRDAKILVEAFDRLVADSRRAASRDLDRVRDVLVRHQLRTRHRFFNGRKPLEPTRSNLHSVRRHARRWSLGCRGGSSLRAGVDRVYQAGRKQLARAQRRPSDANLHELRKQAKYLYQQFEILEHIAPRTVDPIVRRLRALSDRLGEDHDLAMLRSRLGRYTGQVPRAALRSVARQIGAARRELRATALAEGERIYREKPRDFSKRLERLWLALRKGRTR